MYLDECNKYLENCKNTLLQLMTESQKNATQKIDKLELDEKKI
jgi:hypothetical protein